MQINLTMATLAALWSAAPSVPSVELPCRVIGNRIGKEMERK